MKLKLFLLLTVALLMTACAPQGDSPHWYDQFINTAVALKSGQQVPLRDYLEFRDQARGGMGWRIRDVLIQKGFTAKEINDYMYPNDKNILIVFDLSKKK